MLSGIRAARIVYLLVAIHTSEPPIGRYGQRSAVPKINPAILASVRPRGKEGRGDLLLDHHSSTSSLVLRRAEKTQLLRELRGGYYYR